ncbi:Ger(x)C family spore germination protein [Bacillus thuringiensis]|uniref:Ger(x)C family spore germination protein n=1 Tax=Bacillus thuringiensis TaxID=1428 RepID=UPI001427C5A0|nr:Ger(x)C family spore germination protein [Bacillus thuringiensis]NIL29121.1 Ger(x)C family spore germination protein [Bacillus thuringiensis]
MKKIKKQLAFLSIIILLSLSGCLPKTIIDDVHLIQGVVFDTAKTTKVKVTFVCPIQKKGNKVQIFEGIGNTVKQVKADASLESAQPFVSGQLRVALFTTNIAKKGLASTFDTLLRDVSIGNNLYVTLLEGNGRDLFEGKYKTSSNIAIYIKRLLEHNMKTGPLPTDNVHLGASRYYREGQDYYIPILKKVDNKVKLTGIALFQKDKYVGKIKSQDMFIFKGLIEKHRLDSQQFKTPLGYVMINNIRSANDCQVHINNGKPSFLIKVKLDTRIQEISREFGLTNKKTTQKIAKSVEKQLEVKATKLIKQFKSLNVDPLGLGAKYRQHYRPFKLEDWEKMYKDVPVKVEYQVNITNSGVIE